jgi:transcription factor IIIB subunit 2
LEENSIVSSIEFAENTNGASSVVGQFVSATSSKAFRSSRRSGFGYTGREPREVTLNNGRRNISNVASTMGLGSVILFFSFYLPFLNKRHPY